MPYLFFLLHSPFLLTGTILRFSVKCICCPEASYTWTSKTRWSQGISPMMMPNIPYSLLAIAWHCHCQVQVDLYALFYRWIYQELIIGAYSTIAISLACYSHVSFSAAKTSPFFHPYSENSLSVSSARKQPSKTVSRPPFSLRAWLSTSTFGNTSSWAIFCANVMAVGVCRE